MIFAASKADDDELRLIRDLFANYNKNVRPAKDKNQPVEVKFGIAYTQIVDLVSWARPSLKDAVSLRSLSLSYIVNDKYMICRYYFGHKFVDFWHLYKRG